MDSYGTCDLIELPECDLTGSFTGDKRYFQDTEPEAVNVAIKEINQAIRHVECTCIYGSATFENGAWYNTAIIEGASGESYHYHKIKLHPLEQRHFDVGDVLAPYLVAGIPVGIQICREIIYSEPWAQLKGAGAQLLVHVNNAIQPHDQIWKHLCITRALENSVFVCSVNNAASPQQLASYLVSPSGAVLVESELQKEQVLTCEIDLGEVILDLDKRTDY
ncbi:MAG: carbon-nitrogen hydrolase family protein [Sedimentisphaerales bacterium]